MPGICDWTMTPHTVVDKIFDECGATGQWRERSKEYFQQELTHESVLKKLPWLNETPLHQLRSNQVVRFRGMIQDMYDSEFFLDIYEIEDKDGNKRLQAGRYRDIAECGAGETIITDSRECATGDRNIYYCIPIPGETEWVKDVYRELNPSMPEASTSGSISRNKRGARDEHEEESMEMETAGQNDTNKRTRNEKDNTTTTTITTTTTRPMSDTTINANPSTTTTTTTTTTSTTTTTPQLNFPLPGMTGTPCLVKTYGDESFSLNDLIEVTAILSIDPALNSVQGGDDNMDIAMQTEDEARSPPPSLVPRLHVLSARKLSHTNPLLPEEPTTLSNPTESRELLRKVLMEICLGDGLAADLLICHLVSSVYLRKDVIALGKYSINLSGINQSLQQQEYSQKIFDIIQRLVTQAYYMNLTINNLNTNVFVPKKDYQENRLKSGMLQVPQNTHLILNETALTSGQLTSSGIANLTSLGNVVKWQKIDYDFQFHNIEQHTNIPVIILSEGRAMISCDTEVKIEAKHSDVGAAFERANTMLTPEVLLEIRNYLTTMRILPYNLTEDMQKSVQDDFVDSRRNDNGISAEDLHNLLILARLVAVSCGESNLTQDIWRSAKILENERKLRLNRTSDNA